MASKSRKVYALVYFDEHHPIGRKVFSVSYLKQENRKTAVDALNSTLSNSRKFLLTLDADTLKQFALANGPRLHAVVTVKGDTCEVVHQGDIDKYNAHRFAAFSDGVDGAHVGVAEVQSVDVLHGCVPRLRYSRKYRSFVKTYKPVENSSGDILRDYDNESIVNADVHNVWTVVSGDDGSDILLPGHRRVNRWAAVLCAVPWRDEDFCELEYDL